MLSELDKISEISFFILIMFLALHNISLYKELKGNKKKIFLLINIVCIILIVILFINMMKVNRRSVLYNLPCLICIVMSILGRRRLKKEQKKS